MCVHGSRERAHPQLTDPYCVGWGRRRNVKIAPDGVDVAVLKSERDVNVY